MYVSERNLHHEVSEISVPPRFAAEQPFSVRIDELKKRKESESHYYDDLKDRVKSAVVSALKETGDKILSKFSPLEILGICVSILGSISCCGCTGCFLPKLRKMLSRAPPAQVRTKPSRESVSRESKSKLSRDAAEKRLRQDSQDGQNYFSIEIEDDSEVEESFMTAHENSPTIIRKSPKNISRSIPPTYSSRIFSSSPRRCHQLPSSFEVH